MKSPDPAEEADWPEALATVIACHYEARTGRAIAFGLPASRHFHITCNYWVDDQLHTADFYASKPLPQGSLFPLRYNPENVQNIVHQGSEISSSPDWTPRFALAALLGFFAGLMTLPIACSGFVLLNQHRFGDVQSNGPEAVLGGAVAGALVGGTVMLLVWRKSRQR